jgi:hypothetical protein
MPHEQGERFARGVGVLEALEVVDDEHTIRLLVGPALAVRVVERIDQFAHRVEHLLPVAQPARRPAAAARTQRLDRGDDVDPERRGVAIAVVQRQPRGRRPPLGDPACEQRRLPRAGRRGYDGERALHQVVEKREQARPPHVLRRGLRNAQLGPKDLRHRRVAGFPHRTHLHRCVTADRLVLISPVLFHLSGGGASPPPTGPSSQPTRTPFPTRSG